MFNRTTQVSIRTNNGAEAYHRRIGSVMQCAHPTLWIFLQKLIDEENAIHVNILQIKAGQPQRKNKNQRFEERLFHVILNPHWLKLMLLLIIFRYNFLLYIFVACCYLNGSKCMFS